jgi:hypothetical protein
MHRPANPARQNIAEISTWIVSLRLWILDAIACVADWAASRALKLWVQDETRAARRFAKQLIFLLAFARIDPPRRRKGGGVSLRAPRGFCYQRRRNNAVRHFVRGVRLRTPQDIRDVLDDIDAVVARVVRGVRWRARWGGLVLCAASRDLCAAPCLETHAEAADTS